MKTKKTSKLFEWQQRAKAGGVCACGETRNLSVDHIIPVFLLEQFLVGDEGKSLQYEWEDNFEILCKWCNWEKGQRLHIRNPKFFLLMKKLIEKGENDLLNSPNH